MASLLALGAALPWGTGDFLGGIAARRISVIAVLAVSQAAGLVGLIAWVAAAREGPPGIGELAPAAAAGVAGVIGLAAFYRALALGAMGIVAPISGVAPLVPLGVDAAKGITPNAVQLAGLGLVLCGVVTLSQERTAVGRRTLAAGAALSLVAALGFGGFIVGLDAGSDVSAPWGVLAARTSETAIALGAVAVTATSFRPTVRLLPMLVAVGVPRHGSQRSRRLRDHQGRGGHHRRPQRALPDRHPPPCPPPDHGATRSSSTCGRRARARRRGTRSGGLSRRAGQEIRSGRRTPPRCRRPRSGSASS